MRPVTIFEPEEGDMPTRVRCTGKPFMAEGRMVKDGETATVPLIVALGLSRRDRAEIIEENAA
jgi:hypothetical protein